MRLIDLRESVQEDTVLRIFSRLVTVVNNVAELFGAIKEQDDAHKRVGEQVSEVESIRRRVEKLNLAPDQWKNMRPAISNMDVGTTWFEFRAALTKRLLPELVQSMQALSEAPIKNVDAKIAIANERVQNLQQMVVGLAPQGGVSEVDVDIDDAAAQRPENPEEMDAGASAKDAKDQKGAKAGQASTEDEPQGNV